MIPKPRKNEIDTMRIGVIFFIATLLLIGCAHLEISKKNKAVAQVKPGDTKEAVFATLGPPDLRQDINDRRFVAFYQTKIFGPEAHAVNYYAPVRDIRIVSET